MTLKAGDKIRIKQNMGPNGDNNTIHTIACIHSGKIHLSHRAQGMYSGGNQCYEHDTFWVIPIEHVVLVKNSDDFIIRKLNSNNIIHV